MGGRAQQDAAPGLCVPRIFHRAWLGGLEPEWTRGFAATWLEHHPGWELREWTDRNVGDLFPLANQGIYDRAAEIAPDNVGQLRSDVLRYEILHRQGGVWIDTDFECLRPIDSLIEGVESFAAWEVQGQWIANGLMGAAPAHPFLRRLIDGLPASVVANRGARPNRLTGPRYLTAMWRRYGQGVRILDQHLIYPYAWNEIHTHAPGGDWGDAYAVHHWQNMRRERGVPVG